jgi:hypothetical protein
VELAGRKTRRKRKKIYNYKKRIEKFEELSWFRE